MSTYDATHVSINISDILANEIDRDLKDLDRDPNGGDGGDPNGGDGGDPKGAENFTMFRLPANIRNKKNNKELYKPRMVSIGPYYHGRASYRAMEKHKLRYLKDYLSRTCYSTRHCLRELKKLEYQARRCYFEDVKLQSDEFLKMMLLDGCFIVEFFIKQDQDQILDVGWVFSTIKSDLLLFENQIPFFVIQKLFGLCSDYSPVAGKKNTLARIILDGLSEGKEKEKEAVSTGIRQDEIKHILHLYYLCHVSLQTRNNSSESTIFSIKKWLNPVKLVFLAIMFLWKLCFRRKFRKFYTEKALAPSTIPSATELRAAGVRFKLKKSENIFDIQFLNHNGTLEIPFISIEETTRSQLSNMLSFEQCFGKMHMELTSYACFMSGLIKTSRDVTLLQEKGIIENLLPTNKELVLFFNWLPECCYINYEQQYLLNVFKDVNKYYKSDWHKWMATLKRNYFGNPWSIMSFVAASFLLALTALQTFFTVFPYYKPRK